MPPNICSGSERGCFFKSTPHTNIFQEVTHHHLLRSFLKHTHTQIAGKPSPSPKFQFSRPRVRPGALIFKTSQEIMMCTPLPCSCWEAFTFWQDSHKVEVGGNWPLCSSWTSKAWQEGWAQNMKSCEQAMLDRWQSAPARHMDVSRILRGLEAALTLTPSPREEHFQHPQKRDPGQSLQCP